MTNIIQNTFTLDYPHPANRIDLYDFLRGMAMMLVVMQHADLPGGVYITAFHMPLFFFLSGLVSGGKEQPEFCRFVSNKFKRLMVPYLIFGVLVVLMWYVIEAALHYPYDVPMALLGILSGQYGFVPEAHSGIFWFLYVIFMAELLVYPVRKVFRGSNVAKWGGVILFVLLSYGSNHWFTISIFMLDKAFMAAAFILLGSLMKPVKEYLSDGEYRWVEVIAIIGACGGVWISVAMNNQIVYMYLNQYGNYIWFFLGSFCGIVATLFTGKYLYRWISKNRTIVYKIIMWVGFNTLVLYPVHLIVKSVAISTPIYEHYILTCPVTVSFVLFAVLLFPSIPVCNIIVNYFPWMLGMRKNKY